MKRKIWLLLLTVLLLLTLAACGGEEGTATDVPPEEVTDTPETEPPSAAEPSASPVLTVSESVEQLKGLAPALLGLEGDSMSVYDIIPAEEAVRVDEITCIKLSVYKKSPPALTNEFVGVFLLSRDGGRLFKLDPAAKQVSEIALA